MPQSLLLQLQILLLGLLLHAGLTLYCDCVGFRRHQCVLCAQLEGRCCAIAESMHWQDIQFEGFDVSLDVPVSQHAQMKYVRILSISNMHNFAN